MERLSETEKWPWSEEKVVSKDPEDRITYHKSVIRKLREVYGKIADAVNPIVDAAHEQNTDQYLDQGGTNEVAVADVKDAVDKRHVRGHGMAVVADHTSPGGTEGNLVKFDANGYPVTDAEIVAAAVCRIKTGTYTGDGTESQAITGVGFQPKCLRIWIHPTSETNLYVFEKLDQSWGDYAMLAFGASADLAYDNRINSLDADGFTVDDDGDNKNPNADGVVYDYLALG